MLQELICDKFKEGHTRIAFHSGLNAVLGDNVGTNSIGKSTFLLIIDFVFGGSSFLEKAIEVFKNIDHFEVKFRFCFNDEDYHFIRKTNEKSTLYKCDNNYKEISQISINEYTGFLYEKYNINLPDITFRNVVSLYSRVYGKGNDDENKPLNLVERESEEAAILRLLKLFNMYATISGLKQTMMESSERLKAYRNAQKFDLIPAINAKTYKALGKELTDLNNQKESLSLRSLTGNIDLTTEQFSEITILQQELDMLRRQRSKEMVSLNKLRRNEVYSTGVLESDLSILLEYFPNANIKQLHEVSEFHTKLSSFLLSEIKEEKKQKEEVVEYIDKEEIRLIDGIKKVAKVTDASKLVLNRLVELTGRIRRIEEQIQSHDKGIQLSDDKKSNENLYKNAINEQLASLQHDINVKMNDVNNYIYTNKQRSPLLTLRPNSYSFSTVDDRGTGTNYKNMIVLDIAVLSLTRLPILIHDSIILKQISDEAIDKILSKYDSFKGKQIFIALDKQESYFENTITILKKNKVLGLSGDGGELFGRSWVNV